MFWRAALLLYIDLSAKILLVELLPGNGPICQRVDGVNHEVRLGVVLLLRSIGMAMGPDGFHDNLGSRNLLLDVALQNATDQEIICSKTTCTYTKRLLVFILSTRQGNIDLCPHRNTYSVLTASSAHVSVCAELTKKYTRVSM